MTDEILFFVSLFCFCIAVIILQCLFTNQSFFSLLKSDKFRLVTNGTKYKIQQRFLIVFWVNYYGFAIKQDDGTMDVSLTDEDTALKTIAALRKKAENKFQRDRWKTIA